MAGPARPTLRCLREDLALAVPRADTPLEEISHPLLARATELFADDQTPHERIADLLPGRDDDLRWRAETAVRTERRLRDLVQHHGPRRRSQVP